MSLSLNTRPKDSRLAQNDVMKVNFFHPWLPAMVDSVTGILVKRDMIGEGEIFIVSFSFY